jgi:hypothetical protein
MPVNEQRVRERAYELWSRDGRVDGRSAHYWLQAERELHLLDDQIDLDLNLAVRERPVVLLDDLHPVLGERVPTSFFDRLRERNIRTLPEIRAAGALSMIEGITEAERQGAQTLEAHARLDLVSDDPAVSAQLIDAGVAGVTDLARADPAALAARSGLDLAIVQRMKGRATTQRWVVDHDLAGALIARAPTNSFYGFNKELFPGKHWSDGFAINPGPDPEACESCTGCTSALSPAAYLVDLIDFLIDNFKRQLIQTADPTVTPKGFSNLQAIEDRFYRALGTLIIDCETGDQLVRQIKIAIEVLEQFIIKSGYAKSREDIYTAFPYRPAVQPRFPNPDVLSLMFDAYLAELGVLRADFDEAVKKAYPVQSTQPDTKKLDAMMTELGITQADLEKGLNLKPDWEPHIKALDWLPELVRTAKTKGLDPGSVTQLAAYADALAQADAAIGRVNNYALPDIRANLISFALYSLFDPSSPHNPAIITARQLGNYLHIDLEVEPCMLTTRLASAIEALQSWVEAFRLGREDPGYFLTFDRYSPEAGFEPRWRWLRSYATWQAAQSVFLYPENFLFPSVRRDQSIEFEAFLNELAGTGTDEKLIEKAINSYRTRILQRLGPFGDFKRFSTHATSYYGLGLEIFATVQQNAYANISSIGAMWKPLEEWYFYLPLAVAEHLTQERSYELAAAWLHNVFYPFMGRYPSDFPSPPVRLVWPGFHRIRNSDFGYFRNTAEWLRDPFNPFRLANIRDGALLRHVIAQYVENLLDWADAEFARDTAESIVRARELYEVAETVLGAHELPAEDRCRSAWRDLLGKIAATFSLEKSQLAVFILDRLRTANGRLKRTDLVKAGEILAKDTSPDDRLQELKSLVDDVISRQAPAKTLQELLQEQRECQLPELVAEDEFNKVAVGTFLVVNPTEISSEAVVAVRTVQKIGCGFCVPPNSALATLRYRVETNLEKIRTCRNIAGMRRNVLSYASSADPKSIVQATAAGENIEEAVPTEPPPIHRFSYLVERARYYTDVARQLESQLLNAFEREDQERYNLEKARQDSKLARGNTTLHDLRVKEATDGVTLAQLQRSRASFQKEHFNSLVQVGWLEYEKESLNHLWVAHDWALVGTYVSGVGSLTGAAVGAIVGTPGGPPGMSAGAILGGIAGAIIGGGQFLQSYANVRSIASQARAMQATFQRREQEWRFQSTLAGWDVQIGNQGITLANDRVAVSGQEREIALLQQQFAQEVIDFLGNKFTGVELWLWMGQTLRRYYRDHLTYATVTARMAQRALEFERQESIPIIAPVYAEREKRDLLAAEHLLTDINKLDQHRLTTEQRRKELTKIFSLSQLDPIGFNALRNGHGMAFSTLLSHFDRDFPGHYLRLIKSVSLTVIALVPPNESIQATLSNAGISRVMVGPPFDTPKVIQRMPESIAVTAANNGTGLFELRYDDPILLPFEGAGVETSWILDIPRGANRFSFGTLADIIFTIRYTAHEDTTYREKVLTQLGIGANRKLSAGGELSFPLRSSLPDEWYDLFNPAFLPNSADYGFGPGKVKPPYTMQFN